MERRTALKNMGLAFGYAAAAPTLLGLIQSCSNRKILDWTPSFFTKDEGVAIHTLLDIILPKTDTPSATELNLHVFVDKMAKDVLPPEHQDFLRLGMNEFFGKVLAKSEKESLGDLNEENWIPALKTYLKKRPKDVEKAHNKAIESYFMTVEQNGSAVLDNEIAQYSFAHSIRDISVWAYKNSKYVGEEVLAYLPIPGEYVPCESAETLTQGRAWSLS